MSSPLPASRRQSAADRPPALARSLVLVGMMGVGKTTVGRRLAQRLHVDFADADHEIVAAAGMPITEIFARFGEAYFRDGERRVIARLLEGRPMVLATGGGAFVCEATRALILARATAIWLHADLDTLVERVGRRQHRPLLHGRDARATLRELGVARDPLYALAPIHVSSRALPHEATVDTIMTALRA